MKHFIRTITFICAICMLITILPTSSLAADLTESSFCDGVLIESVPFSISPNGDVEIDGMYIGSCYTPTTHVSLEDPVVGTFSFYYNGLDSNDNPKYTVNMSMVSQKNLTKSVLKVKPQGHLFWTSHSKNHSGKTGSNTYSYTYEGNAPDPKTTYCYVKGSVTISDGTTYNIPQWKLQKPFGS